jgi:hypothetical protein
MKWETGISSRTGARVRGDGHDVCIRESRLCVSGIAAVLVSMAGARAGTAGLVPLHVDTCPAVLRVAPPRHNGKTRAPRPFFGGEFPPPRRPPTTGAPFSPSPRARRRTADARTAGTGTGLLGDGALIQRVYQRQRRQHTTSTHTHTHAIALIWSHRLHFPSATRTTAVRQALPTACCLLFRTPYMELREAEYVGQAAADRLAGV